MPVVEWTRDGQRYRATLADNDMGDDGRPNESGMVKIEGAMSGLPAKTSSPAAPDIGAQQPTEPSLAGQALEQARSGAVLGASGLTGMGSELTQVPLPNVEGSLSGTQTAQLLARGLQNMILGRTQEQAEGVSPAPESPGLRGVRNVSEAAAATIPFLGASPAAALWSAFGAGGGRTVAEEIDPESQAAHLAGSVAGGFTPAGLGFAGRRLFTPGAVPTPQDVARQGAGARVGKLTPQSTTTARAGEQIKEGLGAYVKGPRQNEVDIAYDALDRLVKPSTQGQAPKTMAIYNTLQSNPSIIPGDATDILARIGSLDEGPVTLKRLREVRSFAGQAIGGSLKKRSPELRRLYGEMTEDMKAIVSTRGPKALAAFEKAETLNKNLRTFEKKIVDKFAGANLEDSQAFARTTKADAKKLRQIFTGLNQETRDMTAATMMRNMGAIGDEPFKIGRFTNTWRKMDPDVKAVFINNSTNGEKMARSFDEITAMHDRIKGLGVRGDGILERLNRVLPFEWWQVAKTPGATSALTKELAKALAGTTGRAAPGIAVPEARVRLGQ